MGREGDVAQVIKAIADPLRARILGALGQGVASPSDVAREINAELTLVSYHFRVLRDAGLIKRVREVPRRGVRESYYKVVSPPIIDNKAWESVSKVMKQVIVQMTLRTVSERVNSAASAGGFERADAHLSHLPLTLDERGWTEAASAAEALHARLEKIRGKAEARLAKHPEEEPLDCSSVLMLFTTGKP